MRRMLTRMMRKEFLQLLRDKRMFPILFVAPVIQLIILGFAVNFEVEHIPTAVCDADKSGESRDFLAHFFAGGHFVRAVETNDLPAIDKLMEHGTVHTALVIPQGFGRSLRRGEATRVPILVNGSDTTYAMNSLALSVQITSRYSSNILLSRAMVSALPAPAGIDLRDRVWYNPELKTRFFMVPAILGLILMIITVMLTAMAIVREKEAGTMEMLVVTPLHKLSLLLGKLLPFLVIGLIEVLLVTLAALFVFGLPLRGSAALLFSGSLLFLCNTLGLGLLVSTISHTQQQAMMTVMFGILMPFIYLSGFVFPIASMPAAFQYLSKGIALTYYLEIVRSLFLKGSGIEVLYPDFIALTILGVVTFAAAVVRFQKHI